MWRVGIHPDPVGRPVLSSHLFCTYAPKLIPIGDPDPVGTGSRDPFFLFFFTKNLKLTTKNSLAPVRPSPLSFAGAP